MDVLRIMFDMGGIASDVRCIGFVVAAIVVAIVLSATPNDDKTVLQLPETDSFGVGRVMRTVAEVQ